MKQGLQKRLLPLFAVMLCIAFCVGCTQSQYDGAESGFISGTPLPYHEQKPTHLHLPQREQPVVATWLPYFLYPALFEGKSETQARLAITEMLTEVKEMGINTIFAHACAVGEAYYDSQYYPRAAAAANSDYLQILSEACAALELSLHAWINPLRLQTADVMAAWPMGSTVSDWYADAASRSRYMVQVDDRYYLQPASEAVQRLLCNIAAELLTQYDIDGIHIDDYFYPTTDASFDADAFAQSGAADCAAWRRGNINAMLRAMYQTVHSVREDAVFSVSPSGNLQANLQTQYADCALWCAQSGYCDWMIPQIYYGYENQTMPFAATLEQWFSLPCDASVRIIAGLAAYKVGAVDAFAGSGSAEWQQQTAVLAKQTADVLSSAAGSGAALYHIENLLLLPQQEYAALQSAIFMFFSDSFYPSAVS